MRLSWQPGASYDPSAIEREVKDFWRRISLYEKLKYKGRGPKFYFLDGPPYASAKSIHLGTVWNKVIKDAVLRYKRMRGFDVWNKPGYDTHGLPIEVLVERSLKLKSKKEIEERVGIENFVKLCRSLVDENIAYMTRQFEDIGSSFDWENPYVTYRNEYIESGWWLIKKAWERGLLSRELRVVHWCPRCETTLADYEVSEYAELEDPSVYVKLKVRGTSKSNEYLVVWTTTPWTLPANAFVMASPHLDYARVRVGDEILILAEKRVEEVMKEIGVPYEVIERFPGTSLEGFSYEHPLEDVVDAQQLLKPYHVVVMAAEAVSAHEGTGLVHAAPGHGDVDFEVASRLNIPVVSLVDERGRMSEDAGIFRGMHFREEANDKILEELKRRGALLHASKIRHRYPICWRCKSPLLLRASTQWVIRVTAIKDRLLEEARKIRWIPEWARSRFENLLAELRDWVISRQRYWGIPLPIWVCERCGQIAVVGSRRELEELGGEAPSDLHRPWIDRVSLTCSVCGGRMKRTPDVADVWFDSGIAFFASLGEPPGGETWRGLAPVDLVIEGHDQVRGWFFSLLRSGLLALDAAPYSAVLVHGFLLDEQGREMHKSLGNYVEFEELVTKYPRDAIRLWLLQSTLWEDLRFSYRSLEQARRDLTVAWNVFNFAATYMSLDGFDPEVHTLKELRQHMKVEDLWLLSRYARLFRRYIENMEAYELHAAVRELRRFIVEDLSHWYVRIIRRRVWTEGESKDKFAAYAALYTVLKGWLLMAAPFLPFMTEYLYQHFVRPFVSNSKESIHLERLEEAPGEYVNEELEKSAEIVRAMVEDVLALRARAGLKLRQPISRVVVAPKTDEARSAVHLMSDILRELANAKELAMVSLEELRILESSGGYVACSSASYELAIDARLSLDLLYEGLAKELVRRVQHTRKQLALNVEEYIELWVEGDEELLEAAKRWERYVKEETRAVSLTYGGRPPDGAHVVEWDIDGKRLLIGVKRRGATSQSFKSPETAGETEPR
ncbi:MAG: isoleucine--tRNA ligase [Fervidicoccaceae archaeon]